MTSETQVKQNSNNQDMEIVSTFLGLGVIAFLAIIITIIVLIISGASQSTIFFKILYVVSFMSGIGYLFLCIYKTDMLDTKMKRNKALFDFIEIPVREDNNEMKLFIEIRNRKYFFQCCEKLATAIAILTITFLTFKLKLFDGMWGFGYFVSFFQHAVFPFIGAIFFFHTLVKILISQMFYILKIEQIYISDNTATREENFENKSCGIQNFILWLKINLKLLKEKISITQVLFLFFSAFISAALIISAFQLAIALTP